MCRVCRSGLRCLSHDRIIPSTYPDIRTVRRRLPNHLHLLLFPFPFLFVVFLPFFHFLNMMVRWISYPPYPVLVVLVLPPSSRGHPELVSSPSSPLSRVAPTLNFYPGINVPVENKFEHKIERER